MSAVNQVLEEGTIDMEVIVNHKHLDNGLNIIQLEQAVGAAVKSFNGAVGKCGTFSRPSIVTVL